MGVFSSEIDLEALKDGDHWKTLDAISYTTDSGDIICVPPGFQTDLASVPRIFWAILPPFGKYDGAAIVHDYLYAIQDRSRAACDAILKEAMAAEGVGWLTRETVYLAVRLGGILAWNNNAENKGV